MHDYKFAIVIGASSGIGAELVRQLAQEGARVAAVARRGDRLEALASEFPGKIIPVEHDVTDFDAVPALFQEITGKLGGLDLIVYAAGVMPEVGAHEYDFQKDRQMIEVNLLGAMAWLNQAAIRFENTKSGTIVGIGSVAGDRGRSGQPVYNTSKAALTTYLEALRNRLCKHGVRVVTIKPGPTATEMTSRLHMKGMMDPAKVAEITLEKSQRTGEHYIKLTHRIAFAIIRRIPSGIFRKLSI
ncbi:SDR family NAD(P)-dependent oxidoreductase [Fimbriimonas ginsengisoli]|uniref:Short-chain dehydrogenase n=1 Tax=Fimbriimonas ginsengisoli Gsoil 348 TaxID=661478 RepID=A0A068NYU0_FIMGI|nr:SDR family NAD(P)-dependent oxidoreductase [Fimbriimonas ginsengisoli]AIE87409.1 short-chain dehydrogenase [Fimbriimonas ginsengisoli Gsoil 348]